MERVYMKKSIFLLTLMLICLSFTGCSKTGANYKNVNIDGTTLPQIKGEYDGDFSYETFTLNKIDEDSEKHLYSINNSEDYFVDIFSHEYNELKYGKIVDFISYKSICDKYSFSRDYDDEDINYIIVMNANINSELEFKPVDLEYGTTLKYYYYEKEHRFSNEENGIFCVIPTDVDVNTDVEMIRCHTLEEINNMKKYGISTFYNICPERKPVIYLYPLEDNTMIDVSLELNDAELTCTYPKYNDGWSVVADRDGLIKTGGKEYNYLYWEGKSYGHSDIEQGFCVKGSDTAEFLEEKLSELGLNRREANEFIVYWLPLMEQNEYNVISFDTAEYENHYKLNVNPKPDSLIRVFMTWYAADEKIDIEPQTITTPTREGFTVVEWGGSEIK